MHVFHYRKRAASTAEFRKSIERGDYDSVKRTVSRNRFLIQCPAGRAADYPVHVAARAGHRRIVRLLLHRGADPNARNAHRQTAMHLCVLHHKHQILGTLIEHGADPAAVDGVGHTPLDLATLMNERRCLDVLLNCKMPKDVVNKAFYKATMKNNTILMNKLLNRGAEIEHEDESTGFTALLMAVKGKHVRAAQFLLEKGASPVAHDRFSWTCLHFAVDHEHPYKILATMLEKCAASWKWLIDSRTRDEETALHLAARRGNGTAALALINAGAGLDPLDRDSRSPLLTALAWNHDSVAGLMVRAGASVNRSTGSGRSPLQSAVVRNNLPLVRMMLERGAVVVDTDSTEGSDWTVVHMACEFGDVDMLECLLAYAKPGTVDALHRNGQRTPPLVVAAAKGHGRIVDVLLARGADVNARRADGETALHVAVRTNRPALVDRLLDAGACLDARDAVSGRRPLDVAVYTWGHRVTVTAHLVHSDRMVKAVVRHDVNVVEFLLACGISPNMTTEAYGTPLHAAVRHKRYRMMATILSSNRCRTAIRHNGVTPLDCALAAGDARAVKMLQWKDNRRRCRARHPSLTDLRHYRHNRDARGRRVRRESV